tara:strand:+ start:242 stop:751 length:510 start_codon:yes stop_codon:yes gene_type:complete
MAYLPPFNLMTWINENRDKLKPPVGNQVLFKDSGFIVMVIGGPNIRKDFHINRTEEIFYQVEGDITLKVNEGGKIKDILIREGELFLLPPSIPHSPQRPEGTVGVVVELARPEGQLDGFLWYCDGCGEKVYESFFQLEDIVKQLPKLFNSYYSNPEKHTCKACNHINTK